MPQEAASVELRQLTKYYGATPVVRNVSLYIEPGTFVSFLGPSGCGKTTTLRMIAGFVKPSSGSVLVRGRPIDGLPPYRRDMGMVFQNYALFPHLTVFRNVAFGLEVRGWRREAIRKAVEEALELVHLQGVAHRFPRQLSGGQQQRVALARALVINPSVLLLDEPLSNLDAKLREEMRTEIRSLQRRLGITTIFVTHDQEEALALSDLVVVMNQGRVEQVGTPREIYEEPATPFVAQFIGQTNLLEVTVLGMERGLTRVRTTDGITLSCASRHRMAPGTPAYLSVRPERVVLCTPDEPDVLHGRVTDAIYQGHSTLYEIQVGTETTLRAVATDNYLTPGQEVGLRFDPAHARLIPSTMRREESA